MTAKSSTNEGTEKKPAPFDLEGFDLQADAEAGTTLQVRNPRTGEVTGATIDLYGADSRSYRVNLRRIQDAVAAAPEKEPTDADDLLLLGRARNAAAAIRDTGWSNLSVGGEEVQFSLENAVSLLTRFHWLTDQILTLINSRGNFGRA